MCQSFYEFRIHERAKIDNFCLGIVQILEIAFIFLKINRKYLYNKYIHLKNNIKFIKIFLN